MNQEIRKVRISDAESLAQIGAETFFETFSDQNTKEDMDLYLKETFNPEKIASQLKDPETRFFILEIQNKIVAYTKLRLEKDGSLEIERIYVLKEFQGKKFGTLLMDHALNYATEHGCKRVWLGVWEKNEKAINFYKTFGFSIYGSHVFLLGKDSQNDLLMEKFI
jgi:ribosomal protein S18 acetylase RimI-like enzyme